MLTELITTIPDNTETYFCNLTEPFDGDRRILHRRMAVCLYRSDDSGRVYPVFIDETAKICLYNDMKFSPDSAYDTFTVGIQCCFEDKAVFGNNLGHPETLLPLLRQLKAKGIVFPAPAVDRYCLEVGICYPSGNVMILDGETDEASVLPYGYSVYDGWNFMFSPEDDEALILLGKQLALLRYAFGRERLKFDLEFKMTEERGEQAWKELHENDFKKGSEPFSYDDCCRREAEFEALYKQKWEKVIEDSARQFAYSNDLISY